MDSSTLAWDEMNSIGGVYCCIVDKKYLNFMLAACRMFRELDVRMRAHVVLQSDFA